MWIMTVVLVMQAMWSAGWAVGRLSHHDCDVTISFLDGARRISSFSSPGYPATYPHTLHCIYTFIARKDQKVRIRFSKFDLQGLFPLCQKDFLDVYAQVKDQHEDMLNARLTGRFCGKGVGNLPSLIQSVHNILVLSFFADSIEADHGFQGTYEFVDDIVEDSFGDVSLETCQFTARSDNSLRGYMVSPTYPGMYPDNLHCVYRLHGQPGQRVRIRFDDFLLFHGGEYCPFDYVKIYDGNITKAPLIGTFCGWYTPSTVLYSATEHVLLEFFTGQGRLNFSKPPIERQADFSFERRGFNISYEFSDKFVNLEFITEEAYHIPGTECDQRILSNKETNGTIFSPRYPASFPEGALCHYYLDGLMDEQNLEKVELAFTDFVIPGQMPLCDAGYVGLQDGPEIGGGGPLFRRGEVKERFCGSSIRPPPLVSSGPRMVLVLNTTSAVLGSRFVAKYKFITDYGIPGEHIPAEGGRRCQFHYDNKRATEGSFNSPRFPGRYPFNLQCVYILRPLPDHALVFHFDVLLFPETQEADSGCRRSDYIAIYEQVGPWGNYTRTEVYCDKNFLPGPYTSRNIVKVVFHSNDRDNNVGFKINYKFVPMHELRLRCGWPHEIKGQGSGGKVSSPQYPHKYAALTVCEWTVQASRPSNRILMEVPNLSMEGFYDANCQHAVLKVYDDRSASRPVASLCGKSGQQITFTSQRDSLTLRFISSAASLGARGFDVSWTELLSTGNCDQFTCEKNKYCINQALKCDGSPNCGQDDFSDETAECPRSGGLQILHIAIGTSISSFFCLILLLCGFYHRRKFRAENGHTHTLTETSAHDHVEVRYVSAPSGYNTTQSGYNTTQSGHSTSDRHLMGDHSERNGQKSVAVKLIAANNHNQRGGHSQKMSLV